MFRVWLKRRRQERGLTQEELGEQVGYAGQTIRKIEAGRRRPSLQLAMRLAQVLALAPEEQAAWMAAARAVADPEAAADPEQAPPAAIRDPRPLPGLPIYLTPFVGRTQEQAELASLLSRADCRLVTLLGPGGVGKTRLAIETARMITGFPDGVAFVSLAPVAAPPAIVPAIGDALGFSFAGIGDLLTQLTFHLRDRRLLLILDNLEHLLDPHGETLGVLSHLLSEAPDVSLLVTSRERLRLAGEWVLAISGLAVPQTRARMKSASSPALTLFVEHAQRAGGSIRQTPQHEATMATICRLVDGLPLGIELAAAWIRILTLEEIANELTSSLDISHLSPGALPPRHHSLRSVVEHSWRLLNDTERQALRRLSVFQGGFTRESAAQVAGTGLAVLANLADKSLLRRSSSGRYDLHEMIRQYADAQLQQQPAELAATRDQHASYFMRLLADRELRLKGAQQVQAMSEVSAEIDNIRAAWQWAVAHDWLEPLEPAVEVLQWFYEFRSWHQEAIALFGQAAQHLQATRVGTGDYRRALGRILCSYGFVCARSGKYQQAIDALNESYALLRDGRDPVGLARTLSQQGIGAYWIGEYQVARGKLDQSLALARMHGDRWTSALCLTWISIIANVQGAHEEAEQLFRVALADWREMQSAHSVLWCLTMCSSILMAVGKHAEAQSLLRESLMLSQQIHDRYGMALALHNLGLVALQQQAGQEAIYFLREALLLLRLTSSWEVPQALNDLGAALWMTGARHESRRTYTEALTMSLQLNTLPDALQAISGIAAQLAEEGQYELALQMAARVLADPASNTDSRRSAADIQQTVRPKLAAEQAAQIEEQAADLPLTTILATQRTGV